MLRAAAAAEPHGRGRRKDKALAAILGNTHVGGCAKVQSPESRATPLKPACSAVSCHAPCSAVKGAAACANAYVPLRNTYATGRVESRHARAPRGRDGARVIIVLAQPTHSRPAPSNQRASGCPSVDRHSRAPRTGGAHTWRRCAG